MPGADLPADTDDIPNCKRRPDGINSSGRLLPSDPPRLAVGVRHVVNLALDSHPEALADEVTLLAALGIDYSQIPVPFDAPTREHVAALEAGLAAAEGPVHAHCIMNYRVTAFFYLLDRARGLSEAEATARMAAGWDRRSSEDPAAQPWKALLQA